MSGSDPFRFVNSILENKKHEIQSDFDEKEYNPFLTNRALSLHIDCIMYANEINQNYDLPNRMQYEYYLYGIRKMKRKFSKWPKRIKDESLSMLMEYYQVSRRKAEQYVKVLSDEQLKAIKQSMEKGG